MKCEGYGHIQVEYANTWSDDEFEECNEGQDLCNESLTPVKLSAAKQGSSDSIIFASGPQVDTSTYESHASITAFDAINGKTIDVESGDDEEISNEEMILSYKVMYEKLVDIVNENRGLLKKTSQLCREKNEIVKHVNVLKDELLKHGESLNELEQIKKTM